MSIKTCCGADENKPHEESCPRLAELEAHRKAKECKSQQLLQPSEFSLQLAQLMEQEITKITTRNIEQQKNSIESLEDSLVKSVSLNQATGQFKYTTLTEDSQKVCVKFNAKQLISSTKDAHKSIPVLKILKAAALLAVCGVKIKGITGVMITVTDIKTP